MPPTPPTDPSRPLRLVVALGGNAINRPGEEGNITQQYAHSAQTADSIAELIAAGHSVTITHGNGPQVGNVVMRSIHGEAHNLYPLPLDTCVADTQGGMGYMIAIVLANALRRRSVPRRVLPVLTTVLVDPGDPAFAEPTKPIGALIDTELMERVRARQGWTFREMEPAGGGGSCPRRNRSRSARSASCANWWTTARSSSHAAAAAFPWPPRPTAASTASRP